MAVIWTVQSFSYYLICFSIKYIPGNVFRNAYISGFSEIAGKLTASFFLYYVGNKSLLVYSYIFAVIGSAGFCLIGEDATGIWPAVFLLST